MGNTRSRTNTPVSDNEDWDLGLDRPPPPSPISYVEDSDNEDWDLGLDRPPPPSPISYVEDSDNEDWDLDRLRRPASRVVRARRTLRAALDEAWENDRTERARRRLEELEELTRMMKMLNLGRKRRRSW
jgi:hypothetical protein